MKNSESYIIITKNNLFNHNCVVNSYFKLYNKYWVWHKVWVFKMGETILN